MIPRTRLATPADLPYIDMLRRRESEALGFLPLSAYERIVCGASAHRLWIVEAEGDRVGFLYASPGGTGRALPIVQVAVQQDARRLAYASALVSEAECYAVQLQRPAVGLKVAQDLESTTFWTALGYRLLGMEAGGARRGRVMEVRRKLLRTMLEYWAPVPLDGG